MNPKLGDFCTGYKFGYIFLYTSFVAFMGTEADCIIYSHCDIHNFRWCPKMNRPSGFFISPSSIAANIPPAIQEGYK